MKTDTKVYLASDWNARKNDKIKIYTITEVKGDLLQLSYVGKKNTHEIEVNKADVVVFNEPAVQFGTRAIGGGFAGGLKSK